MQIPQITLREHQSLIGLPNCACTVVVQRRAILRSMIDLTCGVTETSSRIHLTKETKADLH